MEKEFKSTIESLTRIIFYLASIPELENEDLMNALKGCLEFECIEKKHEKIVIKSLKRQIKTYFLVKQNKLTKNRV